MPRGKYPSTRLSWFRINKNTDSTTRTGRTAREPGGEDRPLLSFFIPDLSTGGAEQVVVNIVNSLVDRGYSVDLVFSRFEGELKPQVDDRVNVVELAPSQTLVFGAAMHLPALAIYLRERNPAVLFPHLSHVSIVCLALSRVPGVDTPVIPTCHSVFGTSSNHTIKNRVVQRSLPLFYSSADHIIAVSEGVADSLTREMSIRKEDISVIYNPIDVGWIRDRADGSVDHEWIDDDDLGVVLFVGRIEEQKDVRTWLRTFKAVNEKNPDTRGIIVGKGSRRDDMIELSKSLGIDDVVSFPGYVENPYPYMRQSSVFLLSSRHEGLPTVLIEALACGCPIVSTDCPSGPSEILADGSYGALAPVGEVEELAEEVLRTIENPHPADLLQERAERFATDSVIDEYEALIQKFVATRAAML